MPTGVSRRSTEKQYYFDLATAKEGLKWLKSKLLELKELSAKEHTAFSEGNGEEEEKLTLEIAGILKEINYRGIILRDVTTPLVDFPIVIDNIPAFLCWKSGEADIQYWHYIDQGYAGRKKLTGKENILAHL